MPNRPLTLALPLALLALAAAASAGDVKVFSASDRVDPGEVAQILDRGTPKLGKWRSLRLMDEPASGSPALVASQSVAAASPGAPSTGDRTGPADALSLPVPFAFDSAAILPQARDQLDAIAAGIRLLPPGRAVVVEGHTDSIGSEAYNESLSLRRALSVRHYLVAVHGIDPLRLRAVGLGETAPLPDTSSDHASNRRVQFHGE